MDIKLNFINRSNDENNSEIVIFQRNVVTGFEEVAVAWTVIQNCGQGDNHPFTFSADLEVSAGDSYGNFTPRLRAQPGQHFTMQATKSGDQLVPSGESSQPQEVQLLNGLNVGAVDAYVYRSGRLVAQKTGLAPMQMAVFSFKPTIWIGVVSQIQQGQVINSAIISEINTEISLLGVGSANIIMTGGGPGQASTPFQFTLDDVVMT